MRAGDQNRPWRIARPEIATSFSGLLENWGGVEIPERVGREIADRGRPTWMSLQAAAGVIGRREAESFRIFRSQARAGRRPPNRP